MRAFEDLKCHMVFEKNTVLDAINGCLVKSDGTLGCIKVFVYNTEEEAYQAGLVWANNNPRKLKNSGYGLSYQKDVA